MRSTRIWLAAISSSVIFATGFAQTETFHKPPGAKDDSISAPPQYTRLCSVVGCQNLTWRGDHYDGTDDKGGLDTKFWVIRWDRELVTLTGTALRPDPSGNIARGVFTGRISPDGKSVDGGDAWEAGKFKGVFPFNLTWGGVQPSPQSPQFYPAADSKTPDPYRPNEGALAPTSMTLPHAMRWCAGGHCFTITLNNGGYDGVEDHSATIDLRLSVIQFTPDLVILDLVHRNGARAMLAGRISPDGNVLIDTNIRWIGQPNWGVPFNLMWGKAISCTASGAGSATPDLAYGYGLYAYLGKDYVLSSCWLKKSSDLGDGHAATLLAIEYAEGFGVPQDDALAFEYVKKGADRGNPSGEALLSAFYKDGSSSVPKNSDLAAYWRNKAMETDEGRRIIAKEYAQEPTQMQISSGQLQLLGKVFMAVLDSIDTDDATPVNTFRPPYLQEQQEREKAKSIWTNP